MKKHFSFFRSIIDRYIKLNRGSAVVEATLIMPVFLFSMLAVFYMCRCKLAEGVIYEAAAETAEYMAEYAYISDVDALLPQVIMPGYIDDKEIIENSIEGGIKGIEASIAQMIIWTDIHRWPPPLFDQRPWRE